jgi:hypothetical protein
MPAVLSTAGHVLIKFVTRERNRKSKPIPNQAIGMAWLGVGSFSASHRDYFTLTIVTSKISIAFGGMGD